MAHKHSVYDTDTHFSINPITRALKNEASGKVSVIQFDHNSERFTFEIPRKVEDHDMSLCNVIQIHYINIDSQTKAKNVGVYEVDDMQVSPESDDVVILSWLISQNATQLVGSLNFLIRFACVTDGTVDYVWNTAIYSGISVSSGIYNGEAVVEEYADILAQWEARITALEQGGGGSGGGTASGLTLTSPDGTKWAISVSDDGVITATKVTTDDSGDDSGEEIVVMTVPVVRIAGDLTGISADDYVNVTCNFVDEANSVEFTDYAEIAWQGSGSLAFPKKNYKIKLYKDEARSEKNKRTFRDWHETNNFHLKVNFPDATNIMNNMMMHYVTKSYQYLTPLPREGARYTVDGFPVLLYVNDEFVGIYFWNLKQDDKVYNLNEEVVDETTGEITQEADLCYQIGLNNGTNNGDNSGAFVYGNLNSGSNSGKNFADAHAEIDYYWEDRVWDKTGNHPDILYNTIQWVSEATDSEFTANLEKYFDKEYLINYFVIMYTCGMIDSKGKNFNMLYFPEKGVWYPTFWDMDNAFGTSYAVGRTSHTVELSGFGCPSSRLFDKLWANFKGDIVAKYEELRTTLFTAEQVADSVDATLEGVSAEWLAESFSVKYGDTEYSGQEITDPKTYIVDWATKRFVYMDSVMETTVGDVVDETDLYTATYKQETQYGAASTTRCVADITGITLHGGQSVTITVKGGYQVYNGQSATFVTEATASDGTTTISNVGISADAEWSDRLVVTAKNLLNVSIGNLKVMIRKPDNSNIYVSDGPFLTLEFSEVRDEGYEAGYINDSGVLTTFDKTYVSTEYKEASGAIAVNCAVSATVRLAEYDSQKNFVKRSYQKGYSVNFTLDANTAFVRVGFGDITTTEEGLANMFGTYTIIQS